MENVFVHERALCESSKVGAGTRVWAFAHVLPGAEIGRECNVCDGVFIENDVIIGDRVTIKCGVQLWDGLRIESDVFIGPNAPFTNEIFPRSGIVPDKFLRTTVRSSASIGANATILPGIEIGAGALIGAGAVVIRSVPPLAIAVGNPARIVGYVDAEKSEFGVPLPSSSKIVGITATRVAGVTLHEFPLIKDMRGDLSVGEFERSAPFVPKRYFLVFDVPNREIRGEHAHRECRQFLVCVKGSVSIVADDGAKRQEFTLDRLNFGVYLPPMVWGIQYKFSADAVLLVFASHYYDAADYVRDYAEFRRLKAKG